MTKNGNQGDDALLDSLFEEAGTAVPTLSGALTDRILADAKAEHARAQQEDTVPESRPSLLERLSEAVGGWTGLGGLATATIAGFYIGFVQPSLLGASSVTVEETGFETVDNWTDVEVWPLDDLSFEEG